MAGELRDGNFFEDAKFRRCKRGLAEANGPISA